MTGRTLRGGLHLTEEGASDLTHHTGASAGLTCLDGTVLGTASFTGGTSLALLNLDCLLDACFYFFECEAEFDAEVASFLSLGALASATVTEEGFERAVAKHISKLAEDVIHVHAFCTTIPLLP